MKTLLIAAALAFCSVSALANPPQPSEQEQSDRMLAQMRERLQQMQALVQKLEQTSDPSERRKLLAEHMHAMRQGMAGMGSNMMMGAGADQSDHGHASTPPSPEMMQRRMDMMQMMMEQMMQHMQACAASDMP